MCEVILELQNEFRNSLGSVVTSCLKCFKVKEWSSDVTKWG